MERIAGWLILLGEYAPSLLCRKRVECLRVSLRFPCFPSRFALVRAPDARGLNFKFKAKFIHSESNNSFLQHTYLLASYSFQLSTRPFLRIMSVILCNSNWLAWSISACRSSSFWTCFSRRTKCGYCLGGEVSTKPLWRMACIWKEQVLFHFHSLMSVYWGNF